MKIKRSGYTLLIISLSIIVVGIIQSYMIREQYLQKSNFFDLQYKQVVNSSLNEYRNITYSNPLDSAFIEFDQYAFRVIPILDYLPGDTLSDSTRQSITSVFYNSLDHYDITGLIIRAGLKHADLDTSFNLRYNLKSLSLIDFDTRIPVIEPDTSETEQDMGSSVLTFNIFNESNYFSANIVLELDFTRKTFIIMREMRGIMLIVLLTLVVILLAFGYTIRALNKQKKLSDLKSDFIDNISHEFKTPLSSISLAASTLKHPVVGSNLIKRIELSNNILNQNRILNEMIDQVIDASLIENGSLHLNYSEVDMKEFLEKIIEDFKSDYKSGNIHIDLDFQAPDSFSCRIDRNQIYRAIRNLLNNSAKYCNTDPDILVRVKNYQDLVIEIEDNGIGITQEDQKLIFNRFYRSGRTAKNKSKGLGLGLFIVQKIVHCHKGALNLESEPGKGTRISILLPI